MSDRGRDSKPTREQLERRLERERAARHQAEEITEDATTRLYSAMEELKSLNQALRDFVAVASHDLQTPITAVSGFASLLTERWDVLDDADKRRYVATIDRSARSLASLVEDLLVVSRLEASALDTQRSVVVLAQAINEAMQNFLDRAGEISVRVTQELQVVADPGHVQRILVNYLTNAIKYGAPPFSIDVSKADPWVEIRVRDQGDGVPPDFVPRLFMRFARAATSSVESGTGLGLSIVRGLAQANGGDAWYEINDPCGSCFVVRLPMAA
ncbi:MAG: HAMP domain-containing sensor histidine kinase [Actinomycetota bacterium]